MQSSADWLAPSPLALFVQRRLWRRADTTAALPVLLVLTGSGLANQRELALRFLRRLLRVCAWVRAFVSPPSFRRLSVRPSVVVPARLPVVLPLVLPVRLGLGGAAPPSFLPLLLVFGWGGSLVGPGSLGVLARLGLGWAPARSETSFQVSPDFVNVQGACFHIREGQSNALPET